MQILIAIKFLFVYIIIIVLSHLEILPKNLTATES